MADPTNIHMSFPVILSLLKKHNQEHLLQFWNEISNSEKQALLEDIKSFDISEVISYFHRAKALSEKKELLNDDKVYPISKNVMESVETASSEELDNYYSLGLEEISNGKVAVILLAGGQGTRLGVNFPKGMFNVKLPSQRTLFHLQALRIRSLQNLAQRKFGKCKGIIWYIMTSESTHEATIAYFEINKYFELEKSNIVIFKQTTLPCFTFDGKIILDEKCRISKAPDGNGGLYLALKNEKILKDLNIRGIHSVHVFSVDNILVKVADPTFLGYCLSRSADCGVKVVKKRSSDEQVGVVCQVDGYYTVVEYSEISTKVAELQDDKGNLILNSGNICNHYFTTEFLNEVSDIHEKNLDLHIAKKKIPFVNADGIKCNNITNANGIKIEKFIFDVFKYSQNFVVWEVFREEEFSALKNSDTVGTDCPITVRNDLLQMHKKWLLIAGADKVEGDVEICPLLSYCGENLVQIAKNKKFIGPVCLM